MPPQRSQRWVAHRAGVLVVALMAALGAAVGAGGAADAAGRVAHVAAAGMPLVRAVSTHLAGVRVHERIAAGPYTYWRVTLDGEERFLVSLATDLPTPTRADVDVFGERAQLHSNRLNRDFARLLFVRIRAADDGR